MLWNDSVPWRDGFVRHKGQQDLVTVRKQLLIEITAPQEAPGLAPVKIKRAAHPMRTLNLVNLRQVRKC